MIRSYSIILVILSMAISSGYTQELSKHRWKDRIVILLAEDSSNLVFQRQLAELKRNPAELEDRDIVVYQIFPQVYGVGLDKVRWENSSSLYKELKNTNSTFECILMGLDGGIKLRRAEWVACNQLFGLIDQMPMRRAEMRERNRKHE